MIGKNRWRYIHTSVVMLIIILACFTILRSSRNCLFNIDAESVDRLIAGCARTAVETDGQTGRQTHKPTQGESHFPQDIIAGVIVFTFMQSLGGMPHIFGEGAQAVQYAYLESRRTLRYVQCQSPTISKIPVLKGLVGSLSSPITTVN